MYRQSYERSNLEETKGPHILLRRATAYRVALVRIAAYKLTCSVIVQHKQPMRTITNILRFTCTLQLKIFRKKRPVYRDINSIPYIT